MNEMLEVYKRVAAAFATRINFIFETEEALKTEFERNFPNLPFTRTDHWQAILYRNMREAWREYGPEIKSEPTGFDRISILRQLHPMLDYNLFSQVLLNLQTYNGMAYQSGDAVKRIEELKTQWAEKTKLKGWTLDPFAPKAKMIKVALLSEEEQSYNVMVSTVRSLTTIANFTPMISFRVFPKGSTPAFADSNNLSMLGIGADQFLKVLPQLEVYYLSWLPGTAPTMASPDPEKTAANVTAGKPGVVFTAPYIPYPFVSKSGGEVLHDCLFARKMMYDIFGAINITQSILTLLPRMNSLMVVTDKNSVIAAETFRKLWKEFPQLTIQEKSRITPDVEPLTEVKPGVYRHFKGSEYNVLGVGKHTEDQAEYVIYETRDPAARQLWIRPLAMFKAVVQDNTGKWVRRFDWVEK